MLTLTIRTDRPEAEIGLYDNGTQLGYVTWQADRQLSETLHQRLRDLLQDHSHALSDLGGVVVFKGPGSFTGLRIGISVANALADGFTIPIVGTMNEDWIDHGLRLLDKGDSQHIVLPEYGSPPHITTPRK